MTVLLMDIGHMIGSFLILLIFCVNAIIRAKNGRPWLWYSIGSVFQLLVLIGGQYRYSAAGIGESMAIEWIIYFALLLITALVIKLRRRHVDAKAEQQKSDSDQPSNYFFY